MVNQTGPDIILWAGQRAMAWAAIHAPMAAHNIVNDPRRSVVVLICKLPAFFLSEGTPSRIIYAFPIGERHLFFII
jgi:hypothetical protein